MLSSSIAALIDLAMDGDTASLIALMTLAVDKRSFLSRRAAQALWDTFRIKIKPRQ